MKKHLIILSAGLVALLLLASCTDKAEQPSLDPQPSASESVEASGSSEASNPEDPAKTYRVLNLGGYPNFSGANQYSELSSSEFALYYDSFDSVYEEAVDQELVITVDGNEYVCEYIKTYKGGDMSDWHDYYTYRCQGQDCSSRFAIDVHSGRLRSFSHDKNYKNPSESITLTLDECRAIACKYLSEKIEDFDKYVQMYEHQPSNVGDTWIFGFSKYASGIPTCEKISVYVSAIDGMILSFYSTHYGFADSLSMISDEEKANIDLAVRDKMSAIYADVADQYEFETVSVERIIELFPDGKKAIEYKIELQLSPKPGYELSYPFEGSGFRETTGLLVFLD